MKKAMFVLLVLVFMSGVLLAQSDPQYSYNVYKTPTIPVIDGVWEVEVWGNVQAQPLEVIYLNFNESVDDIYDFSSTFWMTWLNDQLYLYVKVLDDTLYEDPTRMTWDWDNIELYFDGDNSDGADGYDSTDDVQLRWTFNQIERGQEFEIAYGTGSDWGFLPEYIDWAMVTTDSGYNLEMAIDYMELYIDPGEPFGLEVQVGDNDPGEGLVFYRWNWSGNGSWNASIHHGTAYLVDEWLETRVETEPTVAADFILQQNYPNPFNPKTNIRYSLPNDMNVSLEVFNIRGERVAMLENNAFKSAGEHIAVFDAAHLPSGFYMYKLSAGEQVLTKKMLLAK